MGLRGWVRRLEHAARGNLESFILEDGTRHYYDPESGEVFLHGCDCIRAGAEGEPFPEPPETIKALTRARNRATALDTAHRGHEPVAACNELDGAWRSQDGRDTPKQG